MVKENPSFDDCNDANQPGFDLSNVQRVFSLPNRSYLPVGLALARLSPFSEHAYACLSLAKALRKGRPQPPVA